MKEQLISIAQRFGKISSTKCTENFLLFECEITLTIINIPSAEELQPLFPNIAERDTWRWRIITESDEDLCDIKIGSDISADYDIDRIESYQNDQVRVAYTIDKYKINGILTVYEYGVFLEYMQNLFAPDFISTIKNKLDDKLILEIWSDEVEYFSTSSISVAKYGELPVLPLSKGTLVE